MTKLNVVIPAVNVMVEIGGSNVEFRKVDRKAQAGDIVKITEDDMPRYVIEGAFYEVDSVDSHGDPQIIDEDGDEYDLCEHSFEVYEAHTPVITESSAEITFDNAHYRKVDRSAREGDVIVFERAPREYLTSGKEYVVTEIDWSGDALITDDDGDEYDTCGKTFDVYEKVSAETTVRGVQYREVKRKAAVGERIKIVNPVAAIDYVMGDEFTVIEIDEEGNVYFRDTVNERNSAYLREYVVLEPVNTQVKAKPKRFSAGDYVKVTGNSVCHDYTEGSVVMITETKDNARYGGQQFRAETAEGERGNWLVTNDVEPATEAEFLAQRKPAEPARLRVGDYAKVIDASGNGRAVLGDIVEVTEVRRAVDPRDGDMVSVKTSAGDEYNMFSRRFAPVTSEEISAARAEVQRKIAVGPFADGGFAQIVDVSKSQALGGFSTGDYVHVVSDGFAGSYKLVVTKTSGNRGYCNADALRQITEAEYKAAVAPEPKFSVGDKIQITRNQCNWAVGTIATITEVLAHPNHDSGTVRALADRETYLADGCAFEVLTAEEAAAIEKKAQEAAKWAKLGRKVGEFKRGDIVEVTNSHGGKAPVGHIGEAVSEMNRSGDVRVATLERPDGISCWSSVRLITPVEQRFDTVESEAQSAAKSAA